MAPPPFAQPVTCAGMTSWTMDFTERVEELVYPYLPEMFHESPVALQPLWDLIVREGGSLVSHWLFAGWLTFATYMVTCLYFTWKDVYRHETKIQKDYWPTGHEMVAAAIPQVLTYIIANGISTYLMPDLLELPKEAPTLFRFMFEVIICFVVGDFLIYWEHRIMHIVPYLRKNIHSVHHFYHAPFSWAGGWVHPLEDVVVVLCQTGFPVFVSPVHPLSFWVFASFWTVCLIEEHSGHDVFWAPYNWMPFARMPLGGGSSPHDIHHYWVNKNFGFVLICWDQMFGTFSPVVEPPRKPKFYKKWWEWSGDTNSNKAADGKVGF